MFKKILKRFGIGLTKEEKIEKVKRKYEGVALRIAIFEIEGVDKIKDPEEWYRKVIDLCAEHELDMTIYNYGDVC